MSKLIAWIDARFPLTQMWYEQWGRYVAPKNFNFWYYFGSLAIVVLVLQIVTGIFLVMIGICTHLGCLPQNRFNPGASADGVLAADWPGGFFCPCHGSKFDLAGRVFQGVPAPTNLEIPPYNFADSGHLVIGLDPGSKA